VFAVATFWLFAVQNDCFSRNYSASYGLAYGPMKWDLIGSNEIGPINIG